MRNSSKTSQRSALQIVLAFIPWIVSMYTLYWLENGLVWTTETPHRGKISVAILLSGMAISFLIYTFFEKRGQK